MITSEVKAYLETHADVEFRVYVHPISIPVFGSVVAKLAGRAPLWYKLALNVAGQIREIRKADNHELDRALETLGRRADWSLSDARPSVQADLLVGAADLIAAGIAKDLASAEKVAAKPNSL